MKRVLPRLAIMLWMFFAACPAYCSTYYLAPTGNDTTGDGSIGNPWFTITKAVAAMTTPGDTTYLRGGTYAYTSRVSISNSGTSGARYNLLAYPGDARPILDFSALAYDSTNRGITLSGSYWYIKGLDIYKAGDNGMIIQGNYNIVEFCSFYENCDTGLQLSNNAAYNQVINCDSYYNYDYLSSPTPGGNADGFSPKLTLGTGNYFYGCRSWNNSDDGYDCFINSSSSDNVTTTFENCWCFKAGYLKDGSASQGNGNGFKMGSSGYRHNIIMKNCLSFQNRKEGWDQNHNLGSMLLYNCTAYNNGTTDFEISEAQASGKVSKVVNCVSYTGSRSLAYATQITDSWQSPFVVTSADFVSIDPAAAYGARQADGNLPVITFMHLAAGSDLIDGGTNDANVTWTYCGSKPDLGCFEYCTGGSPPGQASSPVPATGATNISLTQDISWTAGSGATSRDVYFGTVTPPVTKVISNGTVLTYDTGTMAASTTYYWRVDEKNADGNTTGIVWSFATVPPPPGQATNPTPSTGATNVSLTQDISWSAGSGIVTSRDVYFGTVTPPVTKVIADGTALTYDTGTMASITTYYWRIDEKNTGGTTTGTVWSFTTQDTNAPMPNPMTWAVEPNAISSSAITMTAATASDISGVEYYFANITDPNHDSNWVSSYVWTDTGLVNNTTYTYQVKARDMSINHNETGWSGMASATTLIYDCTSPIVSDLDGDCEVDFFDYALLADVWTGNLLDLAQFATDWLTCNRNPASECWQ